MKHELKRPFLNIVTFPIAVIITLMMIAALFSVLQMATSLGLLGTAIAITAIPLVGGGIAYSAGRMLR